METDRTQLALDLARRQHGLILREQLVSLGFSKRTVQRRIHSGLWTSHGSRVLTLAGTPDDLATRSRIAGLRAPDAVLTGASAAALLREGPWDGVALGHTPHLIAPRRRGMEAVFLAHPGATVGRLAAFAVAAPATACIDLIRLLEPDAARRLAYRAVQQGVLTPARLLEAGETLLRHHGGRQLTAVSRELVLGGHSDGETRLIELLREAGIGGFIPNHRIQLGGRVVVLDLAFPDRGLAIEVDGRAWHSSASRFQSDRTRQNAISRAGWRVLRFTWEDVALRPGDVVAEVVEMLRAAP